MRCLMARASATRFAKTHGIPDVCEAMVESGAEILVVPNGSPYFRDKFHDPHADHGHSGHRK